MSKDVKLVVSINWEVAKRKGKSKWLADNKHLNANEQLSEMFDEKFGKPKAEKSDDKK